MSSKNVTSPKTDFILVTLLILGSALLITVATTLGLSLLAKLFPFINKPLIMYIPLFIINCLFYSYTFVNFFNAHIFSKRKSYIKKYVFYIDLIVIFLIGLLLFYTLGKPTSNSTDELYFEFLLTIIILPFVSYLHYHVNIILNKGDEMKLTDTKREALINITDKLNSINKDLITPYNDNVNTNNIENSSLSSRTIISEMNDDEIEKLNTDLDTLHDQLTMIVGKFIKK